MKLKIQPLTIKLWPALEDLFGPLGACNGCWCMYWRIGAAYRKRPRIKNKADFRQVVKKSPPPGLLAFDGDLAVGWCQITPRAALPHMDHVWQLKRIDDVPVWSISCLYVRKAYRREGVARVLIEAAMKAAKRAGAPAIEAYPFDRNVSSSSTSTGFATTYEKLGFTTVARHIPARPIMRYGFK
jgi:GNAT superfamily N-acetyltransferase